MKRSFLLMILIFSLGLSACNLPTGKENEEKDGEASIQTLAAQTVEAMSTLFAITSTPTALPSGGNQATATQAPTNTPLPTSTLNYQPAPTLTQKPVPCDRASYVADITIDDGSVMAAGTTFTKTWRLKNNGTCTWDTNYRLVFVSGDAMGAPTSGIGLPAVVPPGGQVDVSVTLTAPTGVRTYQGDFMLQNGSGARFGIGENADKSFWVKVVVGSTATPGVFAVTSATLNASPNSYNGSCASGVKITFNGSITANRAGTVKYHFERSDGATDSVKTLDFSGAGTQSVSTTWTLSTSLTGWQKIYIDEPNHQSLGQADFTLTCY
ncbi:MAG: hypothetical protein LWX83_15150 [Anaerolineae bacterium]|nr:hypothetical protein [Anaerolineae bacterium]